MQLDIDLSCTPSGNFKIRQWPSEELFILTSVVLWTQQLKTKDTPQNQHPICNDQKKKWDNIKHNWSHFS